MAGLSHGQVWWADVDKVRPVLVLTHAAVADRLHRILVAPWSAEPADLFADGLRTQRPA